jgi:hypothetical protein
MPHSNRLAKTANMMPQERAEAEASVDRRILTCHNTAKHYMV